MSFFDFFKRNKYPADCIEAYNKLSSHPVAEFYLKKIPKYCPIHKILWIEAGVIDDERVMSFRINYFDEKLGENTDTKVSFRHYGHTKGMSMTDFSTFMRYLSIALDKKKFMFLERGYDDCHAGCIYDKKYAKKIFGI